MNYISPINNNEYIKAIGFILISNIDTKIKIINLVKICNAGINIDSAKLTDTCIIFLDKDDRSFFVKKS